MDRGRALLNKSGLSSARLRSFAAAGLILAAAACASAPEAAAPPLTRDSLRALRWIAPSADKVDALTMRPVACAAKDAPAPKDPGDGLSTLGDQRMLGRLAFESPALLGGAAARMGLSCASCHLNGRGNKDFFVEGVSNAPGTADVTSSLFSKVRGNGAFDPVPIPDLAARDGKQIKDRKSQAFRDKVHGLIVEEFDGQEPPPYVFEAVLAYLDSLDITQCADPSARAQADFVEDYGAALTTAAMVVTARAPADVMLFYIRAARERLERLHERFIAPGKAPAELETTSEQFAEAATAIREGGKPTRFTADELIALIGTLFKEAPTSLYTPEVLRAALAR